MRSTPYKLAVAKKAIAARMLSSYFPIYFVNEYPKSGGTWLKNMLALALEVPPWTRGKSPFQSCVMQTHNLNSLGMKNVVVLHRDGRDVMVSFYYHSFFYNDVLNANHVNKMRSAVRFDDYENIQANLLPFMRVVFDTPLSPKFSWTEFVRQWSKHPSAVVTSYELLRENPSGELQNIVNRLNPDKQLSVDRALEIVEEFTMDNMRLNQHKLNEDIHSNQIAEKPFIRKGSVGGWRESFNDEALKWFEDRASVELLSLGYKLGR